MKKLLTFAFAVLFITGIASAQVSFGLKAGLNVFTIKGEDYDDEEQKSKMGLAIGGLVNIPVNETFSVAPELVYSQEGTQWKGDDYTELESWSFLNIPILAQYNHPSGFIAHTGPQVGLLLAAKEIWKEDGNKETYDIKDEFKSTNFSWVFGAGYKLKQGFGVAARYTLGLSNMVGDGDAKATSNGFNIGAFYMFHSLKK